MNANLKRIFRLLEKLQDDVTPCHPADLDTVFQHEFQQPLQVLYAEFDQEPQAAASLAQARLSDLHAGLFQALGFTKRTGFEILDRLHGREAGVN